MDYMTKSTKTVIGSGLDLTATSARIGQLIEESGLSDKKLGELMNITVQAVNKWRHGRSLPDIENLFMLGGLLGKPVDEFLVPKRTEVSEEYAGIHEPNIDSQMRMVAAYVNHLSHKS